MKNTVAQFTVFIVALIGSSITFANATHAKKIIVNCPDVSAKTKNKLTNNGAYIVGFGTESVNKDAPTSPLFKGLVIPGANIPTDLKDAGYENSMVTYNSSTGSVFCYFKSSKGYTPFSVNYIMVNALNGFVISAESNKIQIKIPIGLTK